MKFFHFGFLLLNASAFASKHPSESETIQLYAGYVTRISCQGKVLASSIGDPRSVTLEILPEALGCALFLRPNIGATRTNLILETSTGHIERIIEVTRSKEAPYRSDLSLVLTNEGTQK